MAVDIKLACMGIRHLVNDEAFCIPIQKGRCRKSYCVSFQDGKRDDLKRTLVGGFQINGTSLACVDSLEPSTCADTPRITRLQPREVELRGGGDQIISLTFCELKETFVKNTADRVGSVILSVGVATAVPKPAR